MPCDLFGSWQCVLLNYQIPFALGRVMGRASKTTSPRNEILAVVEVLGGVFDSLGISGG